jgi:ferredoxin like protein
MKDRKYTTLSPEQLQSVKRTNVDDLLALVKYYVDEDYAHIQIKDVAVCIQCEHKPCLSFCPAGVFGADGDHVLVSYQACVECGSCRIGCPNANVDWNLPRGGHGVAYKFG